MITLRLDKFLKVSRLIKRRTVAKEACDAGRVKVGGTVAKAGTQVAVGDLVTIDFGNRKLVVRIKELKENVPAKRASDLYEVVDELHQERW